MKLKFLRSKFAAAAAGTALCAALGAPAHAANVTWTGLDIYPNWDAAYHQNWNTFAVPTGSDTAIFPTPIPSSGNQIFLTNQISTNPPPIAANLIFNDNWTITGGTGTEPNSGAPLVSALTLTQGTVTVNGAANDVVIDADINLPAGGTLTVQGAGELLLYGTVNGNVLVQEKDTFVGLFGHVNGNVTTQQGSGGVFGFFSMSGNLINNAFLVAAEGTSNASLSSAGNISGITTGTIRVGGNFTQGKSGTLFVPLASNTTYGKVVVNGTATLGGTASAVFVNGYVPKTGTTFTVLTAAGGLNGTKFDTVNTVFGGPSVFATYNSNSVVLTVGTASFPVTPPPGVTYTGNQQSVANNLNAVSGLPQYNPAFAFIAKQGVNNLTRSLNSISPDSVTSNHSAGAASSTIHGTNTQARMDALHAGFSGFGDMGMNHTTGDTSSGFSAQGLAINGDGPSYNGPISFRTGAAGPRGDDGKESKEMKAVAPEENRWGAFLSGTGQWVNVGDTQAARGYNLDSGGFTLGVDYKVTPNFAIGLMGGYTGTTVDLADNGRTWINGGMIGLYATTFVGGWYADTAVTGGYNSYSTRRSALDGDARSNTEGGDLNVLFGTGYDFHTGALTIGPTASFNYTYTGVNGFDEHGSLIPLNVNSSHTQSERTAVGFKASYDCKMGGSAIFRPELRAAWQHEFGDVSTTLSSSFAAGGGGTFDVAGPEIGRDSLLLGAGFAVQFNERCTTFLYYDGELGRTNYISTAVTGGIRIAF